MLVPGATYRFSLSNACPNTFVELTKTVEAYDGFGPDDQTGEVRMVVLVDVDNNGIANLEGPLGAIIGFQETLSSNLCP